MVSQRCRDDLEPWVETSNQSDRHRVRLFAFYEFVYFFTHITMRLALNVMTDTEKAKLGKHLLRYVASVSVDGAFERMPEDLRRRMIREFCSNIQKAEHEYASCAPVNVYAATDEGATKAWGALFTTLGENVARAIGRQDDGQLRSEVATLAARHFATTNLLQSILDFKQNSIDLPDEILDC